MAFYVFAIIVNVIIFISIYFSYEKLKKKKREDNPLKF